jgi:anaerobic ribonucleoside-triphosphate reductase activating protein
MRIARYEFCPYKGSLDVYVSGCKEHCFRCHNPELWDFNVGVDWLEALPNILEKLRILKGAASRVFIFGGEPLDQNEDELSSMLWAFRVRGKEVWLFTGMTIVNKAYHPAIRYVDYLKLGPHTPSLATDGNIQYGIKLSSSNQFIRKLNNRGNILC